MTKKYLLFTTLFLWLALLFIQSISCHGQLVADEHTLLLLHFDGTPGGVQGETPDLSSSDLSYKEGIFDQGAYFGANNQLFYEVADNFNITTGSFEFWIKPNWDSDDRNDRQIFMIGNFMNGAYFQIRKTFGSLELEVYRAGYGIMRASFFIHHQIKKNKWNYLAFTWDEEFIKIYFDGKLVCKEACIFPIPVVNSSLFQIGANRKSSYLEAVLDELRISSIVRTESEIKQVYEEGFEAYKAGIKLSSLNIQSEANELFETWKWKHHKLIGQLQDGHFEEFPLKMAKWGSSAPDVAIVDEHGVVFAKKSGYTTITAAINDKEASYTLRVIAPVLQPEFKSPDPYLANPSANSQYILPVVIINFLPTKDGETIDVSKAPDYFSLGEIPLSQLKSKLSSYDKWVKFSVQEASRFQGYKNSEAPPALGIKVVEVISIYEPTPPGDFEPNYKSYNSDMRQVLERINGEHYVNNLGVKEFWIWVNDFNEDWPSYDPSLHHPNYFRSTPESNMSSPLTGDISNSYRRDDLPVYNTTYTVYGQNLRRSVDLTLHNRGHQLEAMLRYVNYLQDKNEELFWVKFVGGYSAPFTIPRCGDTHRPPNAEYEYDYNNVKLVYSDIEDWKPDNSGTKTWVNFSTWKGIDYPFPEGTPGNVDDGNWYIYWMQNMPGINNKIPYGLKRVMSNWWVFTADWDEAIKSNYGLYEDVDPDKLPYAPFGLTASLFPNGIVELKWHDAAINEDGFIIERADENSDEFYELSEVSANVTQFIDPENSETGKFKYRVKAFNKAGSSTYTNEAKVTIKDFQVTSARYGIKDGENYLLVYPNPITEGFTTFQMFFKKAVKVNLSLFDLSGREVATIWKDKQLRSGETNFDFDINNYKVKQGLYILKLEYEKRVKTFKIIIQ